MAAPPETVAGERDLDPAPRPPSDVEPAVAPDVEPPVADDVEPVVDRQDTVTSAAPEGPATSGTAPTPEPPESSESPESSARPGTSSTTEDTTPPVEAPGGFELLLGLIAKHRLDLTEIALATVTDEFIAHIRAQQAADVDWDLSQASEFLLVAATLLDLKAARLLPSLDPEEEDLELIEARDLLFARLLQYRAFKDVAAWAEERMAGPGRIVARQAEMEPRFAALLPELVISVTPEQLAMIAADALTRTPPHVGVEHLHQPLVSVREQAAIVVELLRRERRATFRELVAGADSTLVVVARFLALLDLFREAAVAFEQPEPLGELTVEWTGSEEGVLQAGSGFDEEDVTTPVADTAASPAGVAPTAQDDAPSREPARPEPQEDA